MSRKRNPISKSNRCLTIAICFAVCGSLDAAIIAGSEAGPFGNLDQNAKNGANFLVDCHAAACAPVSAVNAFAYIENLNPNLYGGVSPLINQPINQASLVQAANNLGDNFMASCHCGVSNGTTLEDTMVGIYDYIEYYDSNVTKYAMQDYYAWGASANIQNTITPKPSYIADNTAPTALFIANALNTQSAVEAYFLYASGTSAHYVTLTGINFDTTTNTGTLNIVDPLGGTAKTVNITGLSAGNLNTDYSGGASIRAVFVETPIPEPGTWLLSGLGALCLAARKFKRG